MRLARLFLIAAALVPPLAQAAPDPASVVPAAAPRTLVLAGRADAFRAYCSTGEGAKAFAKIRADLDREFLAYKFPDEPVTYGDPSPSKRTSDMADIWRAQQDTCGQLTGVAEAATLCWIVTGEEKYFAKAREILLAASTWTLGPAGKPVDWSKGPVPGAADIFYNDEAHFRLWRKLPLIYDQLRAKLSAEDKRTILAHFKQRGARSVEWIEKQGDISKVTRNSIESDLSSHPVRFMPMTGLTALALWDDLPEAREWWAYAYKFYRDQFTPWGGDDGGWGEGPAYWRGTFEHATFQDTLLAIGDPLAYSTPFWKNSPLFCLYNVQPYLHTTFGDVSNAGHFNLEPATADYFLHLARVQQNGFFRSYAALCTDQRTAPIDKGLAGLDRTYPTAAEFLLRNFIVANKPLPPARPLSELPRHRYFADVGWVSLHSALGQPAEDIHVTFKSSPYGSFSHSHAEQNAFILNAWGESLAISSAYREFHNSPHHEQWTRQTKSKNAVLIDGVGQLTKSKKASGKITHFAETPRYTWTTGDATAAYQAAQKEKGRVQRATRDLVFIDNRYVVLRDRVVLATPGKLAWLLHAEKEISFDDKSGVATIPGPSGKATLTVQLLARVASVGESLVQGSLVSERAPRGVSGPPNGAEKAALAKASSAEREFGFPAGWRAGVTTKFPVPVDPKYVKGEAGAGYVTGTWHDQAHLTVESGEAAKEFTVYSVFWPERGNKVARASATLGADGALTIARPDGKTDLVRIGDTAVSLK